MQEKAFFIGLAVFLVWIAAETVVIYFGARLARIESSSLPRAFVAAFVSGFGLLLAVSFARNSVGANLLLWLGMYAAIALAVIAFALRATVFRVIVPWLGTVLLLGAAFFVWRMLPGN